MIGPGAARTPPAVVYTYAPGPGHQHGHALLGGYPGILQCDGYAAYKKLANPACGHDPPVLAFCWSHVRRGFYGLAQGGNAPIASEALERIAALYRIEADIRGESPQHLSAVPERDGQRREPAERMADEMHRPRRASDDRFNDFGLIGDFGVGGRPALSRAAVNEQTGRHAPEVVVPVGDDRPPRGAGIARSGHKHDRRTRSAFIVVDRAA